MPDIGDLIVNNWKLKDVGVLVYSGGKTASTSLLRGFEKVIPTLHTHSDPMLGQVYRQLKDVTIGDIINYNALHGRKLLIMSCYREPISRKISSFFENVTFHTARDQTNVLRMSTRELIDCFLDNFLVLESYWPHLENDSGNFGGIVVLNNVFDKEKGFSVYENDLVKVVMLRFDKVDRFQQIIADNTLYRPNISMDNVSNTKWYKDAYAKFKNELVIPSKFLDVIFDGQEKANLEFFYDQEFIKGLKNYWYGRCLVVN